jgi:hypothetical protein
MYLYAAATLGFYKASSLRAPTNVLIGFLAAAEYGMDHAYGHETRNLAWEETYLLSYS